MLSVLLLFLFTPLNVLADDFNIQGDSSSNWFFQATAFTVEEFPNQEVILYEETEILGDNTSSVLNGKDIFSLTNMGYTRRIPGIADKVYGPPGTRVDVLYFYQNNTGHSVDIKVIAVPLSRSIIPNGDLTKIINANGVVQENTGFLFSGNNLTRGGKYKHYDGMGSVADGAGGRFLLDSWYIQSPLEVELLEVEKDSDIVNLKVRIKNLSEDEYLTNLKIQHKTYEEIFTLLPQEEKYIEYSLKNEGDTLEPFTVSNPNVKERCSVLGGNYYQWTYTDSISVFAKRENDKWVGGGYVQPAVESLCIKRIGYVLKSEEIILASEDVLSVTDSVKKLPQTNKYPALLFASLVVLDLFLWYAFLRRKQKYENKNNNTGLCTKSRKNARERGF